MDERIERDEMIRVAKKTPGAVVEALVPSACLDSTVVDTTTATTPR